MTNIEAIILSIIQSITEFLPVSSSGHLLFFKGIFNITNLPIIFDIIIHMASLIAILIYYKSKIINTVQTSFTELKNNSNNKKETKFILYAILSTFITVIIYFFFNDFFEQRFNKPEILKITFLFTSIFVFLNILYKGNNKICNSKILTPIIAGFFQSLAILPGISRSGSTISSLRMLGIEKEEATYYSFILAIPAIAGSLLLKITDSAMIIFIRNNLFLILLSFIITSIFSYLFLWLLEFIIKKDKFWIFSFYTFILAIISLFTF